MRRHNILVLAVLFSTSVLAVGQNKKTPTVTTISPAAANAGGQAFTLSVFGSNFTGRSTLLWNGSQRPTTTTNSGQLTATIYASDIASPGTSTVSVINSNTGAQSNSLTFTISSGVAVSLTPISPSLQTGGTQQFTATVSGTTNTSVTWATTGGSISSGGVYTAPSSTGTFAVTATSVADTTQSASSSVVVTAPITVAVTPSSVSLLSGATQQFAATVSGSTNTSVTWSTTGGTVSSSGVYTAPTTGGTYTVTATSVADATKSASATVTVSSSVAVSVSPSSASLLTGGTQQFTGTVTGSTNTSINWSTTGGTISSLGYYTAPSTAGTYTVSATSAADPTKSASAAISISAPIQHSVDLSWTPSTSAVSGYNVYRSGQSGGPYSRINSALDTTTLYTDSTVQSGQTYYYVTTAVDSSGNESTYSNQVTAAVPTP